MITRESLLAPLEAPHWNQSDTQMEVNNRPECTYTSSQGLPLNHYSTAERQLVNLRSDDSQYCLLRPANN